VDALATSRCPRPLAADLAPFDAAALQALAGGDREADRLEAVLARTARARGALDVALAEGLHALRKGDRLARLGCHLDDFHEKAAWCQQPEFENQSHASIRTHVSPSWGRGARWGP
jgi:hypothetical protein